MKAIGWVSALLLMVIFCSLPVLAQDRDGAGVSDQVEIAISDTTHVTVSVHAQGPGTELFSPGFGVVFWVSSGNAALLGGEGTDPAQALGNRYDISMDADGGARANMVVMITGPGPVVVTAKVPACGVEPVGRWSREVLLPSPVVINGP